MSSRRGTGLSDSLCLKFAHHPKERKSELGNVRLTFIFNKKNNNNVLITLKLSS